MATDFDPKYRLPIPSNRLQSKAGMLGGALILADFSDRPYDLPECRELLFWPRECPARKHCDGDTYQEHMDSDAECDPECSSRPATTCRREWDDNVVHDAVQQ
jgi:hypothetical protein